MPRFTPYTTDQLRRTRRYLAKSRYRVVGELQVRAWRTPEPVTFESRTSGEPLTLRPGDRWGELFDCAWFHFEGQVPMAHRSDSVVLLLDVHGEMCVVDADGEPVRGLTTAASGFDFSLGLPGKFVLPWDGANEHVDVWADAGCNDLFGNLQGGGTLAEARIAVCDEELSALSYDFEVLLDLLETLPEDAPHYPQIRRALTRVAHRLESGEAVVDGAAAVAPKCRALLAPHLARKGGDPSLRISAVGHAHMDLAWLWPIRETIRKGARTFATALALIERYPDYVFGASQPQYFQWMKDHYPGLFARIGKAVNAGRIEAQGCMWVEADTNVSGGEALVRQILLGRRFWQDELGTDSTYLWLPDVFGYSGALPQILRKAGIDTFATQKLSWSLINPFPHHSFRWQGIDGSEIATHMFPEDTYNGPALPRSVRKIETSYRDNDVSEHALMVFGIGDGGGGPGEEHLERLSRIANLEGLSPVRAESAGAFFEKWKQEAPGFARWVGELYLERHQGTLTTQAANKRYNRKLELALRDLEIVSLVAERDAGVPYPADRLDAIWKEVLLYQFHDILPGSSIKRVYDECVPRYAAMLEEVATLRDERLRALAARIASGDRRQPRVVVNTLSWPRSEWVEVDDGRWLRADVPAMGYAVVDAADAETSAAEAGACLIAETSRLENDLLRIEIDDAGRLTSVVDKQTGREFVPTDAVGNDLLVFVDRGDAWDFPMDYAERTPRRPQRVDVRAQIAGPHAILEQRFEIGHSHLSQRVVLTAGSPRIDFHIAARWRERASMLRVRFPVAIHAAQATCGIQFGHIRRPTHSNTTWDLARDEVVAHQWADLSQPDAGVALLNDCKYGHRIKDGVLDLNLIRSVPHPGPGLVADHEVAEGAPHGRYTDQCDHAFTYSLLPHAGDAISANVSRSAHELNTPLHVVDAGSVEQAGELAARASWITVDAPNVVVEAVKSAEDGSGDWIVRLYECDGASARARVTFDQRPSAAAMADLMEKANEPLEVSDRGIAVDFGPFEIQTLRLQVRRAASTR